jgi:hypothetical protein
MVSAAKAADAKRARQHDAVDVVAVAGQARDAGHVHSRALIGSSPHPAPAINANERAAEGNLVPICLLQPTQKGPLEAAGRFSGVFN